MFSTLAASQAAMLSLSTESRTLDLRREACEARLAAQARPERAKRRWR